MRKIIKKENRFLGKNISIFGASKMGLSAAKVLHNLGANIFISEKKTNECFKKEISQYTFKYEIGINSDKILDADLIIKSPGIPPDHPLIILAQKNNIPVIGEIDFALSLLPKKIKYIAITGSNGKTTTCNLLYQVMQNANLNVILVGHRNTPLSDIIEMQEIPDFIIQEVSCTDLRDNKNITPDIAVLLNIHDDHLDQFKTMEKYADIKFSLFNNMTKTAQSIVNEKAYVKWKDLLKVDNIPVLFNSQMYKNIEISPYFIGFEENIAAAITALKLLNIDNDIVQKTIKSYKIPPHRREILSVSNIKNITFINDAKGTNPTSLCSALAWINKPCVLIAGGRDKNADLSFLSSILKKKVKVLCAMGATGKILIEIAKKEKFSAFDFTCDTFENALHKAFEVAEKDDIVLFSPGASSDNSDYYSSEECGNYLKKMAIEYAKNIK